MKTKLRLFSLTSFTLAFPALLITDWYFKGYGLSLFFSFVTLGLICDQLLRILTPPKGVSSLSHYRYNRILRLITLVLFVQSPVALIYGNESMMNLGSLLFVAMICAGILIHGFATWNYKYE